MSDSHSIQVGDRGVIRCNGSAMDGKRCVVRDSNEGELFVEYEGCLAWIWHTDFEKDDKTAAREASLSAPAGSGSVQITLEDWLMYRIKSMDDPQIAHVAAKKGMPPEVAFYRDPERYSLVKKWSGGHLTYIWEAIPQNSANEIKS